MTNSAEVYFIVWGRFIPSQFSSQLGIEATRTSSSGKSKDEPLKSQSSEWIFSSGEVEADVINVSQLATDLINLLRPFEDKLRETIQEAGLKSQLQVKVDLAPHKVVDHETADGVEIGFTPEVVSFLSNLDASIDVDTYYD